MDDSLLAFILLITIAPVAVALLWWYFTSCRFQRNDNRLACVKKRKEQVAREELASGREDVLGSKARKIFGGE